MSRTFHNRHSRHGSHMSNTPSPLRYGFSAHIAEDADVDDDEPIATPTRAKNPLAPLESSTMNRRASGDRSSSASSHKRGISETSPTRKENIDYHYTGDRPSSRIGSVRSHVKSLSETPPVTLPPESAALSPSPPEMSSSRTVSQASTFSANAPSLNRSTSRAKYDYSVGIGRSDSRRAPAHNHPSRRLQDAASPSPALLDAAEIEKLGHSSTSQLRDLSKMSKQDESSFVITSPEQEVAGMHGRRRFQKLDKAKSRPPGYGGRTWIDQQRQFLQAYEYLCHIGEAKDWIEDVIGKQIPPIVRLEEALRDGVTLAEIVQSLKPQKSIRIFRHERLQFRHSDNIAVFFRYLAEVELPDLFRFELVDLYDRKNIPKVIYCIHALSWLLLKKGIVDFRIGNLVGQLQFEDHELEATQKGLDKAGVSMPNFSGIDKFGAAPEPEPEPEETEEEKRDRELRECEAVIEDFQSQIRGAFTRTRLGEVMSSLWDHEPTLIDLQSRFRALVVRERSSYHLQMRTFAIGLQSKAKGFLVRSRLRNDQLFWDDHSRDVVRIQSLFRARKAREATRRLRHETRSGSGAVCNLQAIIRGAAVRRQQRSRQDRWQANEKSIVTLQRLARGMRARDETQHIKTFLQTNETGIRQLQSAIRAYAVRHREGTREESMQANEHTIVGLQSLIRAERIRLSVDALLEDLHAESPSIISLQAEIRGFLQRSSQGRELDALGAKADGIVRLQSLIRANQSRSRSEQLCAQLRAYSHVFVELQSQARAAYVRNEVGLTLEDLAAEEDAVVTLQACIRAFTKRKQYAEKKQHYEDNVKKVIKAQSYIRARQQGEAYKTLTKGKDPPANTIKNFAHLLNDSDFDFEEEVEIKRRRESVRQLITENEQREGFIGELDTKIGLLARNKIERDEVAKLQKHIGTTAMRRGGSTRETVNVKTLNREARAKLDLYEELFFLLQTQPQYLSRLFLTLPARNAPEGDYKRLEGLVMSMFGHLQQQREEYYMLKLVAATMQEELHTAPAQDMFRTSHFYSRLFTRYSRAQSDRKFLRSTISKFINDTLMLNEEIDLESDPLKIYRAALNNERLRTGQSRRPMDVPAEIAIKDPETREIFIQHLQDLRDVVDAFMTCIEESLPKMPYGVRFLAQQMFFVLRNSMPSDEEDYQLLQLLGCWMWKSYFKPAFEESEMSLEQSMNQTQRNNKKIFVDVMGQIISGRPFEKQPFLQPLANYVQSEAIPRVCSFWATMVDVQPPEAYFDMDPLQEVHAKQKPTLSLRVSDMFDIHEAIAGEVPSICANSPDAVLAKVIKDLGNPRSNRASMNSSSGEITLSLGSRALLMDDPDAELKTLFMETKRCVLYIVRVQQGSSLMDIMLKPVTPQDEDAWAALVREELATGHERAAYSEVSSKFDDIASISYRQLKAIALQNIVALERAGKLSRGNQYQDLLNDIAVDIRHRNKRRVQRRRELEAVRSTEGALKEKAEYLEDKLKTYNDTFEQNLNVLQKQRRKKQFLMPFSKQYNHQKELERMGRMPKYGSFKYSAQTLWDKGILLSWGQHAQAGGDVTISSDQVNSFSVEGSHGSMMIPGASATFTWDELLEAQFEDKKELRFFGGHDTLIVDREAFMGQVSKKFWPE